MRARSSRCRGGRPLTLHAGRGRECCQIHLCGDPSAAELIERLCNVVGDEFVAEQYERRSSLQVEPTSLEGDLARIRPGEL